MVFFFFLFFSRFFRPKNGSLPNASMPAAASSKEEPPALQGSDAVEGWHPWTAWEFLGESLVFLVTMLCFLGEFGF